MTSIEDKANGYVLGSLSAEQREAIARERLYNSELDEQIRSNELLFADFQAGKGEASVSSGLWARISDSMHHQQFIFGNVGVEECSDGSWSYHGPGIEFKPLWSDKVILIRCNPGAVEESHQQPADDDEHIMIVAGDVIIGGRVFGTGDYICIPAGSTHQRMSTNQGCLLFTEYKTAA